MLDLLLAALISGTVQPPTAESATTIPHTRPEAGKSLYDADGKFLGVISRVYPDGSVRLILENRIVAVPGSSVSTANGKLRTSFKKGQLRRR